MQYGGCMSIAAWRRECARKKQGRGHHPNIPVPPSLERRGGARSTREALAPLFPFFPLCPAAISAGLDNACIGSHIHSI